MTDLSTLTPELLAQFPTIVTWNRLEGRPRATDFTRALSAEVRDPLWFLTRQWQLGEFDADDAGTPVLAKIQTRSAPVNRYQPNDGNARGLDGGTPLETLVERDTVAFTLATRVELGQWWEKLLATLSLSRSYASDYRARFPITLPAADASNAAVYAHRREWQWCAAVAGRAMDGGAFHDSLAAGVDAVQDIALGDPGDGPLIRDAATTFLARYAAKYSQPSAGDPAAWDPAYLEHRFRCSAPDGDGQQTVLVADEYHHGHLDWYSVDRAIGADALATTDAVDDLAEETTETFIPAPLEFGGMPRARWWEFEDAMTDFGDVDANTTDIAKLLVIEFGLLYSNDWFLIPRESKVGTLSRVTGLAVTDVFGERTWIAPAGTRASESWQRWTMYGLSRTDGTFNGGDALLYLPAAVPTSIESAPVEEAAFVRDEMANMVWGIENRVMLASGRVVPGAEAARELRAYFDALAEAEVDEGEEPDATLHYRLMSRVPENWIPFIPVHVSRSNRETQLRRGVLLRYVNGLEPARVTPRTSLLSGGVDAGTAYYVHEEEVPRGGTVVSRTYQRVRWTNGGVVTWVGRHKRIGRGEVGSGLRFDYLEPQR